MRTWLIAGVLLFAAAPALAQTTPLPAPTMEGAVRVAADQSGQTIQAAVGSAIAVELQASASTGSSWAVTAQPDFLGAPESLSGATVQSTRPILGAPRWQVFVFPVTAAGEGQLVLEKRGPGGATVVQTFAITVTATAE